MPVAKLTTELCKAELLRFVAQQKDWISGQAEVEFGEEAETPGPVAQDYWVKATDAKNWRRRFKLKLKHEFTHTWANGDGGYVFMSLEPIQAGSMCRVMDCIAWGGALKADVYSDPTDTKIIGILLYGE